MDRLEKQDINPYTVPGPAAGTARHRHDRCSARCSPRAAGGAARCSAAASEAADRRAEQTRRRCWCSALCVGYGVVLVGHGLPFWLAAAIFVTAAILVLQRLSAPIDRRRRLTLRASRQRRWRSASAPARHHHSCSRNCSWCACPEPRILRHAARTLRPRPSLSRAS